MASRKTKISKRVVDGLGPDDLVWDTDVTGFGVRCQRRSRVYILKARIGRRQRWFTIGKHGSPWTVERARNEARKILGEIASGNDPATKRDVEAKIQTLAVVAERFLTEEIEAKRRHTTAIQYRDFLERLVLPKLGNHLITGIKRRDITTLHHDLRATPVTANRVLAVVSSLMSWCEGQELRPQRTNPAMGITKFDEESRERFLSVQELACLGDALNDDKESPFVVAAIRLLILTGARRNEILTLQWSFVDFDAAMLRLPISKTGRKIVYLNAGALEVLADLPRIDCNPFVIPGERAGQHLVNLRKPWLRICKRAEIEGVRIHDLRHSFASVAVSGGASLPVVGRLLGHTKSATTEKYSHLANDPVRAASEAIGRQIAATMRRETAEIVPLGRKASGD